MTRYCEYYNTISEGLQLVNAINERINGISFPVDVNSLSLKDKMRCLHIAMDSPDMLSLLPYSYLLQVMAEYEWIKQTRPYYKVHSSLIPAIESTKLDVTWDQAGFGRVSPISIEFEYQATEALYLRSVLLSVTHIDDKDYADGIYGKASKRVNASRKAYIAHPDFSGYELAMIVDYNEKHKEDDDIMRMGQVEHSFLCVPLYNGQTLEERISSAANLMIPPGQTPAGDKFMSIEDIDPDQRKFMQLAMRAAVMVLALRTDPAFVTPEVLSKDQAKFVKTGDKKYVDKAIRNGKYGFLVGFDSAGVTPHLRRWHMAWRWYGEGKKLKRLVKIKPTIVRRDRLSEVPQGWHDELASGSGKD
jgi:hypothetical protein